MLARVGRALATLLSHWRRHPLQLACLLLGLWLATALWAGVQALNEQARDSYDRAAQLFGAHSAPVLVSADGRPFDQALYVHLRRLGWTVSPVLQGPIILAGRADTTSSLQLLGIDPLTLPRDNALAGQRDTGDIASFMSAPGRTWIAPDTAAELGVVSGQRLNTAQGARLPPLAVRDALPPGLVITDIGYAQPLLGLPGQLTQLLVADVDDMPALPDGIGLRWTQREEGDLQRLTDSFHMNLTALGLLAFLVGLFIVQAAAGLAMQQRRQLIQTLRACGASVAELGLAMVVELVSLALIAGALGMVSGFLLAWVLIGDLAASVEGLYGAAVSVRLDLSWSWWLSGLGMSLAGTLLAGGGHALAGLAGSLVPSRHAPGWQQAQRRTVRRLSLCAALLLSAALVLAFVVEGLIAGFALLGCVLLGATLMLPLLLAGLIRIGRASSRGPLSQWFWADSRQQLSGLSLALMALLLALAANIGVGGMTEGFRLTFNDWLDRRLAADVYVRPASGEQAQAMLRWLRSQPSVSDVIPSWQTRSRVGQWPTEVSGVVDHPLYRQTWPLIDAQNDAWDRLHAGIGVLVSEQLANRAKLKPGDEIELDTPGGSWSLNVVGSYPDYGNPRGQVLVGAAAFQSRWPAVPIRSLGILAEADPAGLADAISARFEVDRVADQASLKRYSSSVFEQTFAATAALNGLTLGVAAMALFTSLLGLADNRLAQLAPIWAMGLRRGQLSLLTLAQLAMLATFTCLLAIPLGLVLSWCLVAVVNVQAFGWRLPWHWFPAQWWQLMVLALLAVLLAAAVPTARLMRAAPDALLRRFAHDA